MRFLIDAQLPPALCRWLEARGHEGEHVAAILAGETPDVEIARHAARHGLVLMTKDEDFLTRHPPTHYTLVWLRLGNASNRTLSEWLEPRLDAIVAAIEAGERLVEVR